MDRARSDHDRSTRCAPLAGRPSRSRTSFRPRPKRRPTQMLLGDAAHADGEAKRQCASGER